MPDHCEKAEKTYQSIVVNLKKRLNTIDNIIYKSV